MALSHELQCSGGHVLPAHGVPCQTCPHEAIFPLPVAHTSYCAQLCLLYVELGVNAPAELWHWARWQHIHFLG